MERKKGERGEEPQAPPDNPGLLAPQEALQTSSPHLEPFRAVLLLGFTSC